MRLIECMRDLEIVRPIPGSQNPARQRDAVGRILLCLFLFLLECDSHGLDPLVDRIQSII